MPTNDEKIYNARESHINNKHLNKDKESIKELFKLGKNWDPDPEDIEIDLSGLRNLVKSMHSSSVDTGKLISKIPDFIIEDYDNGNQISRYVIDELQ